MFFAVYDDNNRVLRYVNCGHNPRFCCGRTSDVERAGSDGDRVGAFRGMGLPSSRTAIVSKRDLLVIYTDGISEAAPSEDAEGFRNDRLIAAHENLIMANRPRYNSRRSDR